MVLSSVTDKKLSHFGRFSSRYKLRFILKMWFIRGCEINGDYSKKAKKVNEITSEKIEIPDFRVPIKAIISALSRG